MTEGVADGLVAAQAGFPTVGVLGSQYPDRRVVDSITTTMERSPALAAATVVVCFDGDPSGRAGAERLCGLLAERGIPQRQLSPPDGHDLTDWARAAGATWASGLGAAGSVAAATSPTVTPAPTVPAVPPPTLGDGTRIARAGVNAEGTVWIRHPPSNCRCSTPMAAAATSPM